METSGLESWEFPGKNGMGTPRNTSMGIHRNSWGKKDWLQEFPRKQDGHQKFLGKMGLAPAIPWESGMGIPRKLGWTLGIPRKTEFIPKKKKIRLGLHRESGVRDWGGNQGLDPVGIWDLGIGSHSQRQSQGIPGTFLMAYVGSPGRIRTILPSQNSATTRSFFQPCQEFPKKPFRTVDPGIWDWGILESQDWRILRLGDPKILRLGDPRIGGSWNSRTGGF